MPPIVLDTPELAVGSIVTFDQTTDGNDLRLGITVRDDNVNDELRVRARLTVSGLAPSFLCPGDTIFPSGEPQRPEYELILLPTDIRRGACTRVEVWVSSRFDAPCLEREKFDLPLIPDDVARATFWVWEMSDNPTANAEAAKVIVNSCQTLPRAPATAPMPMGR